MGTKEKAMSNLRMHAETELKAVGYKLDGTDEPYNDMAVKAILQLIDVFDEQGHSGFSAPYVLNAFSTLAKFEPLAPLTGADDEWNEVGDGVYQNKRCSRVFKQADRFNGQAYDIDGRVFREKNGGAYTSSESFVPVTFPYTPKTEYVEVEG